MSKFHVALTADFYCPDGAMKFSDIGLSTFEGRAEISVRPFAEHRPQIGADQLAGANGVIVLTPQVTRASVADARDLLAIGRFGVGYDSVDVGACTDADVLVCITVGAVDRPVAEATVGWMIALTHHMSVKHRLVHEARWDERSQYMGRELRDRTLGVIGLGGIARKLIGLLAGWEMRPPFAYDPHVDPAVAQQLGVRLVELDELLQSSDFVSIHCPLTATTRGLIGRRELGLMRPDAYLINTARGGIVDEDALYDALATRRLGGSALDVWYRYPTGPGPTLPSRRPFHELPNVLMTPHVSGWTEGMMQARAKLIAENVARVSRGERPLSEVR